MARNANAILPHSRQIVQRAIEVIQLDIVNTIEVYKV
jgi:hypothetical protein